MNTWSCNKRFIISSGVLDLAAESALHKEGVRREMVPGAFRWNTYVDAPSAGDAVEKSREVLAKLFEPYGIEILVTDSDTMLVQHRSEEYCSVYCEHNADKVCECLPCVFIRTQTGYAHEFGCKHADKES